MRLSPCIAVARIALACAAFAPAFTQAADGLTTDPDHLPWTRWEARVSLGFAAPVWRSSLAGVDAGIGLKAGSVGLMADHYFGTPGRREDSARGGFRATSGVIVGPRSLWWAAQPGLANRSTDGGLRIASAAAASGEPTAEGTSALPYVGLGYTQLGKRSGWNVSADLGVIGSGTATARLERPGAGYQLQDDTARDGRWSPAVQFGVSRSF